MEKYSKAFKESVTKKVIDLRKQLREVYTNIFANVIGVPEYVIYTLMAKKKKINNVPEKYWKTLQSAANRIYIEDDILKDHRHELHNQRIKTISIIQLKKMHGIDWIEKSANKKREKSNSIPETIKEYPMTKDESYDLGGENKDPDFVKKVSEVRLSEEQLLKLKLLIKKEIEDALSRAVFKVNLSGIDTNLTGKIKFLKK